MKKLFSKKALGYIALALVCVMAGSLLGSAQPKAQADTVVLTSPFTEAVAKVHDSVVGVNNYQIMTYDNGYGSGNGYGGSGYGFPWDYFFGYGNGYGNGYGYGNGNGRNNDSGQKSEEVHYASGSGVVVAEHYVMTNYHVTENAHSLKVSVVKEGSSEPELYEAKVAAYDEDKDVAVLYVPDLQLKPVELGDSDSLVLGDWAICIGNPLGFTGTVTTGVISGLDRDIAGDATTTDKYGRTTNVTNKMIQTDAAINNGISGGGMFNTAGQLIGIPTLKYSGVRSSSGAYNENVGMCIPVNEAKPVIEEALKADVNAMEESESAFTDARRTDVTAEDEEDPESLEGKPRMGVTVVDSSRLSSAKGQLPNGAYITQVDENSPADKGGIQAGDIVVEIDGDVISSVSEMTDKIRGREAGDELQVKVFRPDVVADAENGRISTSGKYLDLKVTLEIVDVAPVVQ